MNPIEIIDALSKIPSWVTSILAAIAKMCMDILFHVKARTIQVPGEPDPRPIVKGQVINLPANTGSVTVRGTYWFKPPTGDYALFARRGSVYWPQGHVNMMANRTWDAQVHFGSSGLHNMSVVKMTPEIKALHGYYRSINKKIDDSRKAIANSLGVQPQAVILHVNPYQAIEHMDKLPAFHSIQDFDIVIAAP